MQVGVGEMEGGTLTAQHLSRERKMRTNFFRTIFEHPRGLGHPGKIPGTSQKPKENKLSRARTFRPPPLRVEDPHQAQKLTFVLFFLARLPNIPLLVAHFCLLSL